MASRSVDGELLSARQLAVAVMVCGLSWVGAEAGRMDWRWSVAAVPLGVLLGWLLLRRVNGQPLFQGVGGGVLAVVYGGWGRGADVLCAAAGGPAHRAHRRQ